MRLTSSHVLFMIDLQARRAHLAGITASPNEAFTGQVAWNLTNALDGLLTGQRFLIPYRDDEFSSGFRQTLSDADGQIVLTPRQEPDRKVYAIQVVLSVNS